MKATEFTELHDESLGDLRELGGKKLFEQRRCLQGVCVTP